MSTRHSSSRVDAVSRQGRLWPWYIAAGPALVVVASLVSAWLAVRSDDGLVAADYYKQGLLINRKLPQKDADAAGTTAVLEFSSEQTLRVTVTGPAPTAYPPALHVRFSRPQRNGEGAAAVLTRGRAGEYEGSAPDLADGRWVVTMSAGGWSLPTTVVTLRRAVSSGSGREPSG